MCIRIYLYACISRCNIVCIVKRDIYLHLSVFLSLSLSLYIYIYMHLLILLAVHMNASWLQFAGDTMFIEI